MKQVIDETRWPVDVSLQHEGDAVTRVVCNRCDSTIGRLQTFSVEPEADQEEIYSEIRLIVDEHRPLCSRQRSG